MAIATGLFISLIGVYIAFLLSKGKSKKRKAIVWGILLMIPISPALSFSIGLMAAWITKSGWSAFIMVYVFPALFLIGLIMLLVGIFQKDVAKQPH